MKTLTLQLDDLDYDTIQAEIAHRQQLDYRPDGPLRPDGESCVAGTYLAECIRDLLEYRLLWLEDHDNTGE